MKENKNAKRLPGFYIALCCCVVAIGVAGFIAENQETENTETPAIVQTTDTPLTEDIGANEEAIAEIAKIDEIPTQIPEIPPVEDYTFDNPDIAPVSIVVNAEESCQFSDPLLETTVLFGYVTDNLIYNEVYGDWRTHNGLDLAAPLGCSVNATAAGTVIEVAEGSYGKTVKIEHTNGFMSVYCQLGEVNVNVGDNIDAGAVIGTVGESMGENVKETHLHYELYKNGKPVNPEEY